MESLNAATHEPDLRAAPEDPFLGVHVLTEFVYCARAGLVAQESPVEDFGEDDRPGRLDYLPRYDLANIEAALMGSLSRLAWLVGMLLMTAVVTVVLGLVWHPLAAWLGVLLTLATLIPIGSVVRDIARLVARRAAALSTAPGEPLFGTRDEPQPIDWWQLRNAGFTAKRYDEPLRDEPAKLSGRPYLVLCRGDIRIPVFRQHRPTQTLYRQHFVRLAAYCHLIQQCTGYRCPYGVILFGNSYQGVALRNAPAARQAFCEAVITARRHVRDARRGVEPRPPPPNRCANCPVGRPVAHRPGITETVTDGGMLPVRGAYGPEDRLFHSPCGDRFRWLPPHERAQQLPLRHVQP